MAELRRRVVVTGGRSPLGRRVAERLAESPAVEHVRRVEGRPKREAGENAGPATERDAARRRDDREDGLDVVPFVPDHRPFAEYLEKERIDTVLQCGLVPDRSGLSTTPKEADVIGTMCLGAAIGQEGSPVRSWVLASSSAVYPIDSHAPLVQHERQTLPREEEGPAASIAEAEDYARDVAHRLPYVNVAILRLQELVGPGVRGPLAALLARPRVPEPIGFDATIQLLHLEDAASALAFAAAAELAGVYNVASRGVIHWSDAVRATGRPGFPVLPMTLSLLEPLLASLQIPHVPAALVDLLRFGHTVDTQKLEQAGWRAELDQRTCLQALRREHSRRA